MNNWDLWHNYLMSVAENFDLVIGERSLFFPHNEKSVKLFDSLVQGVITGNVKLPLRRAAKKPWLTSPVTSSGCSRTVDVYAEIFMIS